MLGSAAESQEVNQFLMTVSQFLQLLNRKENAVLELLWDKEVLDSLWASPLLN